MTIHQQVRFSAEPSKVYDILTKSDFFAKMTGGRSADISTEPGGAVSLFGGDIKARNVELVPGKRVVQAWRSHAWPEGVYSIVKFELEADGDGTVLTFDQAGYPDSAHEMLEGGWSKMYWTPMQAMLSAA